METDNIRNSKWKKNKVVKGSVIQFVKLFAALAADIPFAIVWFGYYLDNILSPSWLTGIVIMAMYAVLYFWLGKAYDAFLVSYSRINEMVASQILAVLFADGFMFIILWLLTASFPNILPALLTLVIQVVFEIIWCVFAHRWYFRHFRAKRSIIIYDVRGGLETLVKEYGLDKKFKVEKVINVEKALSDLSILDGIEVVFFSGVHSHERNVILKYCVANDITSFIIPRIGDVIMSGAHRMHLFHLPMLSVGRYNPNIIYLFVKRFFDVAFSLVLLILLSPIFLITAIAIKKDGGPAFYKQVRLTKDGQEFKVLKFRSMRVDAEKDGVARLSSGENDDRITKVGHIIRACRVDELPQLINILKGEMSVVGPRPERPEIAAQYEETMPEFRLRLQAKAGLTGYAQVYGKYNTTPYDKLNMDLMYISNPSILEDFRIIMATVGILFSSESTEGVEVGQTTAMGVMEKEDME